MDTHYEYDLPESRTENDDLASGVVLAVIVLAVFSAVFTIEVQTGFPQDTEGQIQQDTVVAVAE